MLIRYCNFTEIARATAGFTGADLENLLNEAALLSARAKKKEISMATLSEAIIKVIAGNFLGMAHNCAPQRDDCDICSTAADIYDHAAVGFGNR